ncbi:hypothetical protein GKZ89_12610 [Bacillus mangrovi]|uniref:Zinc chelation protein SecC n=1 Tax=Metabacillus mangrovi TaxID=1491830 RepID=A0A7X2S669_9BACI|nr:SEC-C metal-binding domain-containing protein [Metabacillus mangrovi]MTH54245.1 hypothetical protein [Metabacillus mangrovi]
MTVFLKTIQPYILSKDPIIQDFAMHTIDKARLGNEETFHLALDANDQNIPQKMTNKILPYTKHYQIGHKEMQRLVGHIKRNDDNFVWYLLMLSPINSDLIEEYYEEISSSVDEKYLVPLENIIALNHLSAEELQEELAGVLKEIEKQRFYDHNLFSGAKRIYDRMIKLNAITAEEIQKIIQQELHKEYFSYEGFLAVYAAGELKIHSLVKDLAKLLLRGDEEILIGELEEALIKIGSDEVIAEVAPYALDPNEFYSPIATMKNIKSDLSVEKLLSLFDQATDLTAKTLMAEALCSQLSTEAIPKVADFMEEGYDDGLLELEKHLYATCIITGVDHPKLNIWKSVIEKREAKRNNRKIVFTPPPPSTEPPEKISRNAPCPCGSGKKYKKCCGK